MVRIPADRLTALVQAVFHKAGCQPPEDGQIARRLVESNLVGHDSHGVIRVAYYIDWLKKDMVRANQKVQTVFETDTLAVLDGQRGFGQSVGEQAMALAIEKARKSGLSVLALRNTAHLGRIGDWPQIACDAGLCSLFFVNTSGFGLLVAPWGGIDRRLSANPVAAGVPVENGPAIIYDISTSSIAEGKLKVAFNKGVKVPAGSIIDSEGRPTDDPKTFYGNPPGAILPFGGHKGYGLGIIAEMFAGALTGSGCSDPKAPYLINGLFALLIDPNRIPNELGFATEVTRFIDFVKQSRKATPDSEILMPGEIEARTRAQRLAAGIELDDITWKTLVDTAKELGVAIEA
ncbi:MAG: malate/lactate/ureidoglycolate dehydrogenase [Planctomycetaceae bacterium]|nr:MAG: malate/lactate/ureidoglycolate dehydrogenase [Planctomycetaceae bacterium]